MHLPPSVFWFLFHVEKEPAPQGGTLPPPAGGEIPCENLPERRAEVVAPYKDAGKRLLDRKSVV